MSLDASSDAEMSPLPSKRKASDDFSASSHTAKRPHIDQEQRSPVAGTNAPAPQGGGTRYWMVQWRKPQTKKHKTWDGDGVLVVNGSSVELQNLDRQRICQARNGATIIKPGEVLNLGGKEICVDHAIPPADFFSGKCFDIELDFLPPPRKPLGASTSSNPSSSSMSTFKPSIPKVSMRPAPAPFVAKPSPIVAPAAAYRTEGDTEEKTRYWTVQWRKPQTRKNKSWDGDGYVSQCGTKVVFMDEDSKVCGSTTWKNGKLKSGDMLYIGGKEVGVDARIANLPHPIKMQGAGPSFVEDEELSLPRATTPKVVAKFKPPVRVEPPKPAGSSVSAEAQSMKPIPAASFYGASRKQQAQHDPKAANALVMTAPDKDHQRRFNTKGAAVVPVVVDPVIGNKLRPHQREGVTFMYESVMGMKKHEGHGCILADEMGLGKTIQTIALIWTLLRQNPYANSGPIAGKVLIVCPVSLIKNWRKEIHKWLGKDRIDVLLGDKELSLIKQFKSSRHHVLIIGYERLRSVINDFAVCRPPIGLIVCDEGHRLKSADSKTTKMFDVLDVPRRIILSGTPVQNNLGEFHAMTNFCNPDLLDSYKVFNRMFEAPILKSRAPNCTPREHEEGSARAEQLMEISRSFVLRRTADILQNYLPPKNEYVVFVRPTKVQLAMFKRILNSEQLDDMISRNTMSSLALITNLMQLCNSPAILRNKEDSLKADNLTHMAIKAALKLLPPSVKEDDMNQSGKMIALANILKSLRTETDEKVVIVSHYTATLDLIEKHCKRKKYTFFRLDGRTRTEDRQMLVDRFNRSSQKDTFVFLLSTKAGGVGLNLIGASRLVLVDSDWNPAHDLQAMARIHRDGQKRPVFIYRLLTSGTIDEKIFQRAITKMGLSESLVGQNTMGTEGGSKSSKGDSFSQSELRDLFSINETTSCGTHELIGCRCVSGTVDGVEPEVPADETESDEDSDIEDWDAPEQKSGFMPASQYNPPKKKRAAKGDALSALSEWTHIHCDNPASREYIHDATLLQLISPPPPPPGQSLLEAIDNAELTEEKDDFGKIAFVFEKIGTSDMEPPADAEA